ncbi:MAG: UxaA family hydrolase [Deltaproteobacteria bacterium]|nr:UxaA family hydrolase [Deltaproteobacteria bacterium]MBW2076796.1 UxaA family hydrolase [Deltaproteobacteria bacterium]MBW2309601.1 UxaA family hydrolase [Deltaproteobacteria bacterium]
MKRDAILIHDKDNVATALRDIRPNEKVVIGTGGKSSVIQVQQPIPYGHKFAVRDIPRGEDILKYGEVMGRATQDIAEGTHAHIHNIESLRGRGDLER